MASHAEATCSSPWALSPTLPSRDGDGSVPMIAPPNPSPASLAVALELLDDHLSAPTEVVLPPPCSDTTQPSVSRMADMEHVCGEDVLAACVVHSLTAMVAMCPDCSMLRHCFVMIGNDH